jgi:hypothetical protein
MNGPADLLAAALTVSPETERNVAALMRAADRPAPRFWEPGVGDEIYVPVEGGRDPRVPFQRPRPRSAEAGGTGVGVRRYS